MRLSRVASLQRHLSTSTCPPPRHALPSHRARGSSSRRLPLTRELAAPATSSSSQGGEPPVLLLDVMDTIVVDPFYGHMPAFFGLTFDELLAAKHPTAWVEFELGAVDERQLLAKFFRDGRQVDGAALVRHMTAAYEFIDGMEPLLARLSAAGVAMHAMSNYPCWWRHVEAKLELTRYLPWTFVSCEGAMRGVRKPKREAFERAAATLSLPPGRLLLVDDREVNVAGARDAGLDAVRFTGAAALEQALLERGLRF